MVTVEVAPLSGLEELAAALADLPPIGEWVTDAACAAVGPAVFAGKRKPTADELVTIERVCRRCPVRQECADYAASTPVWGVWAGRWHDPDDRRSEAA